MGKFGKWIGGGLGWAFAGPIGAMLGFAIGSMFDNAQEMPYDQKRPRTTGRTRSGDFGISLLVLAGAVMKADGKILKSELDYVKQFIAQQFGEADTREKMLLFKEILKQDIDLQQICYQIKSNMVIHARLQLIHFLFGISKADGHVHTSEVEVIDRISHYLGISSADFNSIKAMFYKDANAAYKILEVSEEATDDEVKKAYRKMAVKYHPDKLIHLGEEFQKSAKEKFQKVNEAYETIKKERGFN
jgi:DnaJ like chaperone protein